MAHTHKIVKCKCGNVVSQCRCPAPDKIIEMLESCERCAKNILAPETKPQQRQRISEDLALQIAAFSEKHNNDSQAVGLAVFSWLVEARIKIEDLEKPAK